MKSFFKQNSATNGQQITRCLHPVVRCSRVAGRPKKPARRTGFTLLELLIVISMMIFITTIAVMNYFGAMRSAGFTAVSSNVFNSLLMSRQRACLDNKPVCFYLSDATNYVLQEAFGEISDIKPDGEAPVAGSLIFYVQYCDLSGFKSNTVLLNMDQPNVTARAWADAGPVTYDVSSVNPDDPDGNLVSYPALAYQIRVSPPNGTWNIGDRFGMELFSPQKLPKGFHFVPAPIAPLNKIVFNPDGTVDTDPAHGISSLVVKEKISDNQVSFTIDPNGKITQGN